MFKNQHCQLEEAYYSSKLGTGCYEERTHVSNDNSDVKKESDRAGRIAESEIKGHEALETENYPGGLMSDCQTFWRKTGGEVIFFFFKFIIPFCEENIKSFLRTEDAKSLKPKMRRSMPGKKLGNLCRQRLKR